MKSLSRYKKAFAIYEIMEEFEAGIQLNGSEVKSCKKGNVNLKGSFVSINKGEVWTEGIHISRYKHSSIKDYEPTRKRKLLLHKKEIAKLESQLKTKGVTIVPLELYLKGALIKLKIGVCRGKKQYDRRNELKKKSQNIEINRQLKNFS